MVKINFNKLRSVYKKLKGRHLVRVYSEIDGPDLDDTDLLIYKFEELQSFYLDQVLEIEHFIELLKKKREHMASVTQLNIVKSVSVRR